MIETRTSDEQGGGHWMNHEVTWAMGREREDRPWSGAKKSSVKQLRNMENMTKLHCGFSVTNIRVNFLYFHGV